MPNSQQPTANSQHPILHVTPHERSGVKVTRRGDDQPAVISGYAAVFHREGDEGTQYRLWDDLWERIMPGAFDRALKENHDARGLFNHDKNLILGRRSAGTLRISVDETGLRYEIDAAETTAGRDTVTSIERGDVTGSSFAFIPRRIAWIEADDVLIRQVEDVDLYDVGPVTFPAYDATSTSVRGRGEREQIEREIAAWRAGRINPDAIAVRARLVEIDAA